MSKRKQEDRKCKGCERMFALPQAGGRVGGIFSFHLATYCHIIGTSYWLIKHKACLLQHWP